MIDNTIAEINEQLDTILKNEDLVGQSFICCYQAISTYLLTQGKLPANFVSKVMSKLAIDVPLSFIEHPAFQPTMEKFAKLIGVGYVNLERAVGREEAQQIVLNDASQMLRLVIND